MSTLYFIGWFFYARSDDNLVHEYGPYRDKATCNIVRGLKDEDGDSIFAHKSKCFELQKMPGVR